jgi:hypothetical protein
VPCCTCETIIGTLTGRHGGLPLQHGLLCHCAAVRVCALCGIGTRGQAWGPGQARGPGQAWGPAPTVGVCAPAEQAAPEGATRKEGEGNADEPVNIRTNSNKTMVGDHPHLKQTSEVSAIWGIGGFATVVSTR